MDASFVGLQTALAGRYSLERELGRGGMGIVYLAHEVALDRPVALKLLPREAAAKRDVRERFLREARTAARLSHPHIVPIFAVDEVDDYVFFAMAAIEGETLGERVRARGPLTSADATRLMKEVAWALAYAHAQGVVHRDVKPDNILIENGTGRALVTDFGIAEVGVGADGIDPGADAESGPSAAGVGVGVDRVTAVVGTAEFMSPEQAKGSAVDARSDLYSLAAVAFYAVSGRAPFEGPSAPAILGRHLSEPAPRLANVVPGVSVSLAGVVDRCLRKDPERRFLGGESVADALAQDAVLDRQLPVPLRVFIRNLRRRSESASALTVFAVLFLLPMWMGMAVAIGLPAFGVAVGTFAAIAAISSLALAREARKLLKAGFTLEDARLALLEDVNRRNEEIRFDVGARKTPLDAKLNVATIGLLGTAAASVAALWLTGGTASFLWGAFGWTLGGGLVTATIRAYRHSRRADLGGERWLKVWGSRIGDWLFRIGGIGVAAPATVPSGVHRSTEVALGLAAVRLFEELPKETRRELRDLPDTVRRLETDARALRTQVKELSAVLSELEGGAATDGASERERVRADVEGTRAEAEARLRQVVTQLETIRVGLLRMHAGESIVHSVTMELETARGLSGDMEDLLAGHREVERLLAERHAARRL